MQELELMIEAYRQLYEIENKLRLIIKTNMVQKYGDHWVTILHENKNEEVSHYHELIAFFGKYPQVLPHFSPHQRKKLMNLTPIRNKIAHSQLINETENKMLEECYRLVMKQPINKRNRKKEYYSI
ncbi:hypothetical protein [Alkalihalobacillus sp. BA299]|uniref:hypothetical protein n=1 Tax=Alkalihalobacillus sp. BA299 TaxID=2815938 RepID=UPI001ADC904E|nr:hypothetical protein [Alkalihalobacillus sp. BA299]